MNTQMEDKLKLDYVKINSQWAKNVPKVRKTASEETVEQIREKKSQRTKSLS